MAVEGRQSCNEGHLCCHSGEGKRLMGLGVTHGGMPSLFVFRGHGYSMGIIHSGRHGAKESCEGRRATRVLWSFNPESCE